ncbi:hypothetical protein [Streptomyces sp. UG1]|uniref:hypothetical protein n=1 Tax=Streptomyces sp. UG1 TaxID=3417652 RepID=UPI003CFAFC63
MVAKLLLHFGTEPRSAQLGYRGVESRELSFEDHRVPADVLLGVVEGRGFARISPR